MPLAITLIVAAFASSFLFATYSNKGSDYWVVNTPIMSGHTISASDVVIERMNLVSSSGMYLSNSDEPVGMVATRIMKVGEIIGLDDLASAVDSMSTSAVPISPEAPVIAMRCGVRISELEP